MDAIYDFDRPYADADRAPDSPLLGFLFATGLAVVLWTFLVSLGLTFLW